MGALASCVLEATRLVLTQYLLTNLEFSIVEVGAAHAPPLPPHLAHGRGHEAALQHRGARVIGSLVLVLPGQHQPLKNKHVWGRCDLWPWADARVDN